MKSPILYIVFCVMLGLACFLVWPEADLIVSRWFYTPGKGFLLAANPLFLLVHDLAYYGARILGVTLVVLTVITALYRKAIWHVGSKGWLFLFLALLIGPGLTANVILKDNWGRARPREVTEFGGAATFSSAWIPQQHSHKNDSFVAGDAAFGFYLPCFAYVVSLPKKRDKQNKSRRLFWSGVGVGAVFGFARIAMGAHFLSDVFFAAFFMLAVEAALHAVMYRRQTTAIYWRSWFFDKGKKEVMSG
jgi:lipid A 4'-phosphatase